MTLLVDNQLPVALARYLAANGWECAHVQHVVRQFNISAHVQHSF